MTSKLSDLDFLHSEQENRGLIALNGTHATPEQHRDLICLSEIGSQYFEAYVNIIFSVTQVPWCLSESDIYRNSMF